MEKRKCMHWPPSLSFPRRRESSHLARMQDSVPSIYGHECMGGVISSLLGFTGFPPNRWE